MSEVILQPGSPYCKRSRAVPGAEQLFHDLAHEQCSVANSITQGAVYSADAA